MYSRQMAVNYHGFHPSQYTQDYLESILQEIQAESPHRSFVKATFSRKNHSLKAVVQVCSARGTFFASATGNALKEVSKKVLMQMRKRLERAKTKKMHDERRKNWFSKQNQFSKDSRTGAHLQSTDGVTL